MIGQNDENLTIVQQYVSRKCTFFSEDISSEVTSERKAVFSPNIFTLPAESIGQNLVSVMMPFSPSSNSVYGSIQSAAQQQGGGECTRADNICSIPLSSKIFFHLYFAHLLLFVILRRRIPTYFMKQVLGKQVTPITQSEQDIPFDLQHHRHIKYLNNNEGLDELQKSLSLRFSTLSAKRNPTCL